ncbi:hypothetical protein [Enterobacter sp. DE0047]|uniref:hypothetical protein n=1 Tax=Enterobacter sp. DE0047 TaxID=2584949 RepID=UPI00119ECCCD|nr:hypothetical protein [Enterobacter sp. DE0047]
MKQKLSHIAISPVAFGVRVEWLWPDGSHWFHRLELQYVRENQIPIVQIIEWPVTGTVISGLKAGEKIHVRMRGLDNEGNGLDWNASDWIEGASSTDVQEIVDHILQGINESQTFKKLVGQNLPTSGGYVTPQNYTLRVGNDENGSLCATGFGAAVENGKKQVEFKAEKFEIKRSGTVYLKDAVISATEMKTRLSDDMREAVIDVVRESDLFKSRQASLDAQASSQVTMQLTISQAVTDAIRNAVKHGGLLSGKR